MNSVLENIKKIGIVPVVKIDREEDALPLAKALIEGGLPCAEITFRTAAAKGAISAITAAYPDMLVGAGTVLTRQQVDESIEAGAKFIVSPGLNPEIVKYCIEKDIPVTPGCANPSDIEQALALGLEVVKFFPAEAAGGLAMIKAMAAPYVNVKFMPTGGINAKNLNTYLDFDKILACGGSWMVSGEMINAGEFDKIKDLTREAVEQMLGFELDSVIVPSEENKVVNQFASIIGSSKDSKIRIKTNYIERAVNYLETQGIEADETTARYTTDGKLKRISFKEAAGSFTVQLVQKSK